MPGRLRDGEVKLNHLGDGIKPYSVIVFAGKHSYAGGGTSTAATLTGLLATDVVVGQVEASTNAAFVIKAVPTANTLTFTLNADPAANTVISYVALRRVSEL